MNPLDFRSGESGRKGNVFYMVRNDEKESIIDYYGVGDYPLGMYNGYGYVLGDIPYRLLDNQVMERYLGKFDTYDVVEFRQFM